MYRSVHYGGLFIVVVLHQAAKWECRYPLISVRLRWIIILKLVQIKTKMFQVFSVTYQKVAGESKLLIILSLWLLREVCCMLHVLANHFQVPSQKISIPVRYCKILMIIIIVILHLKFVSYYFVILHCFILHCMSL